MAKKSDLWDVIILGAGAAGMTAAIYTCRKKLKTLNISPDIGGQTNLTNRIENYPGVEPMPGFQLMSRFMKQAQGFGAKHVSGKVDDVNKAGKNFRVKLTSGEEYEGRALILTFGKSPRALGIPGEEKFMGKGVSTCVTCDGPVFANKVTAVVGGGNSALEGVLELNGIAKKVYLIHRRDQFRGDEIIQEKVKKAKNVELVLSSVPVEIKGDKFIKSIVVENVNDKKKREIPVDGVFIEIGYEVKTEFIKKLVKLNEKNEIIIDYKCQTSQPGIFAAGDVTTTPYKQTVISAGEGAKAGLQAYAYLQKQAGKPVVGIDW